MHTVQHPSMEKLIIRSLNDRRCHDQLSLYHTETPYYWRLSDFSLMWPKSFNVNNHISKENINAFYEETLQYVPKKLQDLKPRPVHIVTYRDDYALFNPETGRIERKRKGENQKFTNIACEYIFRQMPGFEFQQAYFLFPNQNEFFLKDKVFAIQTERYRNAATDSKKILSSIINAAAHKDNGSFGAVFGGFWSKLYGFDNYAEVCKAFNIDRQSKDTPLNHMTPVDLNYMTFIFNKIIFQFCNSKNYTIEQLIEFTGNMGLFARNEFIRYGTLPERKFMRNATNGLVKEIHDARKELIKTNYSLSLQQR